MNGFIPLDREFFEDENWLQKRTFSLSEAWLDLLYLARFDADPTLKKLPNGRLITIERGEIHASLRFLSARWGWGVEKTLRYINSRIEKHSIERRIEQGESILKLCNYERYNPRPNTDRYSRSNTDRTPTEQIIIKKNKVNKDKEYVYPYQDICRLYNATCINFPKVISLSDARKNKVRVRINEFRKVNDDPLIVAQQIFDNMEKSKFLQGDNKTGWKASFDWVFENEKNWVKIYEGTYDNNGKTSNRLSVPAGTRKGETTINY